ncbi:hypothetical protein AAVH_24039 [Aphelenchoides avenae]|nr:hypothetical protein AAVH_24039 [Aphelenchus avenae]
MKRTFPTRWIAEFVLEAVNSKWKAIYHLYKRNKPAPPLTYLSSFELPLVLKVEVDDEDVSAIFAHGKPLEFWGCPRLFVSKIAEAFSALRTEPAYFDVTILCATALA